MGIRALQILALDAGHTDRPKSSNEDEWFEGLTKEQQEKYIEEHPNSKYAKRHGFKSKESGIRPKLEDRISQMPPEKKEKFNKIKDKLKKLSEEERKFFAEEQHKPGSEQRRKFAEAIKSKTKGFAKAMKEEVKEWKTAVSAVKKIAKREELDHHDKKALKVVATHMAINAGLLAATGGLSASLSAIPAFATHALEHSLVVNLGRAAAFASVSKDVADMTDDEILEYLVEMFAEGVEKADIDSNLWLSGLVNKKEESSRIQDEW